MKGNLCDEKENTISNQKTRQDNTLTENKEMADSETKEYPEENENVNHNSSKSIDSKPSSIKEDLDEETNGVDNDETSEINYNALQAGIESNVAAAAANAANVLNDANALFNTAMFSQPGQMSMQTFQNAIAQFTANAIANNMDNETVMKNLAILQSALFTLQQQQFLQFQLIQHLQSQLVTKKGGDGSESEKLNSKSESDDEEKINHREIEEEEMEEEENEIEEDEIVESSEIHKRLLDSKHGFSKMDQIIKENEKR